MRFSGLISFVINVAYLKHFCSHRILILCDIRYSEEELLVGKKVHGYFFKKKKERIMHYSSASLMNRETVNRERTPNHLNVERRLTVDSPGGQGGKIDASNVRLFTVPRHVTSLCDTET